MRSHWETLLPSELGQTLYHLEVQKWFTHFPKGFLRCASEKIDFHESTNAAFHLIAGKLPKPRL